MKHSQTAGLLHLQYNWRHAWWQQGATQSPVIHLTESKTHCGSLSSQAVHHARADRLTLVHSCGKLPEVKRRSGPRFPRSQCFFIVCAGSPGHWAGRKNSSSSLMKCNLLRPNIIYHPTATVFLCLSVSLVNCSSASSFTLTVKRKKCFLLLTPFYLVLASLYFFFAVSASSGTKWIRLTSCPASQISASQLFLTFMGSDAPQAEFPLLIYAALCLVPPWTPPHPYRNVAPMQLRHWFDKSAPCV